MTINPLLSRLSLFLALTFCLGACSKSEPVVISVSREDIQQRLDAKFPVEKRKLMTQITFSEPKAVLAAGADRVGLSVAVSAKPPMIGPFTGNLTATGNIDYRFEDKSFFLKDVTIDSLEIAHVDARVLAKIKGPIEAVVIAYLAEHPVFEFKGRNLKEITAEYVLRSVSVENGELKATIAPPF